MGDGVPGKEDLIHAQTLLQVVEHAGAVDRNHVEVILVGLPINPVEDTPLVHEAQLFDIAPAAVDPEYQQPNPGRTLADERDMVKRLPATALNAVDHIPI